MERLSRWWRRGWLAVAGVSVIALAGYGGGPYALIGLGSYLVMEAQPGKADAIVVLGGDAPYRAMEAARLYRSGWAPRVLLTRARRPDAHGVFERLGITPPAEERTYDEEVLLRLGVPSAAVVVLERRVENTKEELIEVAKWAEAEQSQDVILVTSKMHTRRVRALWRSVTRHRLGAVVVYARDDPFDPKKPWWRNRQFAGLVLHEYLGLVNLWLGSPI